MTPAAKTADAEPRHIKPPVMRNDLPYCPRCGTQLRFEHDEYACIACGYEYLLEPRDIELLRFARRPYRAAAAIAAPIVAMPLGASVALLVGLAAVGYIAATRLRGRGRRRALLRR
jgi:ribosomal protein S27AE